MAARESAILRIMLLLLPVLLAACNLASATDTPKQAPVQLASSIPQSTQMQVSRAAPLLVTTTPLPLQVVDVRPTPSRPTPALESVADVSATPAFEMDVAGGPAPLEVLFTPLSVAEENEYRWDFGDGVLSAEPGPRHLFVNPGNYTITLKVTSKESSANYSRRLTVEVPVIPEPIAALVAIPRQGVAPLSVEFDASDSSGLIDSHDWNFGDGNTSRGMHVLHRYELAGSYVVSLAVTGPGGQSLRDTTIVVLPPPVAATSGPEQNG